MKLTKTLSIVADENIPQVREIFSSLGQVHFVDGRRIRPEQLVNTDILLVRSVTKVNKQLLKNSSVRFVGTATIGTDHLDINYLDECGITWANAPGSNADSVVDYVFSALCQLQGVLKALLLGGTMGIVGAGNVGGRLYRRCKRLGIKTKVYDPFLSLSDNNDLCDLKAVLAADVVCLHTPLTRSGPHPTYHLISVPELDLLRSGAVLLNAGRGEVICHQALAEVVERRPDLNVVLDVWENEPDISQALLAKVCLATPHIAGYSYDGKVAGVEMIYKAACTFFKCQPCSLPASLEGDFDIDINPSLSLHSALKRAVNHCYDINADDRRLRERLGLCVGGDVGLAFDLMRKNYPARREFSRYRILNCRLLTSPVVDALNALGFKLEE